MKKLALDWYAQVEGCFLVALGICFLSASGLLVGGTAGIAILVNTLLPVTFGFWFFLVNLPFFYLAIRQMGKSFAIRSLICIVLVSTLSDILSYCVAFKALPEALGAMIAGGLIGIGLILLFRYRASLGGVNILALYMEERFGIHSGKTILSTDLAVAISGLALFPLDKVIWSLLGFVVLSSVLGRYHKKAPIKQQALKQKQDEEGRVETETTCS